MKRPTKMIKIANAVCLAFLLCGCADGRPQKRTLQQEGESIVLVGEEPAALAYLPHSRQPLRARSSYEKGPNTTNYVEGVDFIVDYAKGTLWRTPQSRLPDFRKNMLFGKEEFDHTKFPGFGNTGFFAFVDYAYVPTSAWPAQPSQENFLKTTKEKLKRGEALKIVAYSDSITAGGDATKPELVFWRRWAAELQRKHPKARITAVNGATGGDNTVNGMQRLENKVLAEKPDLVLVGFGMNDHNKGGVPIPQFEQNLKDIIKRIRQETSAEVILFSAFPPNPRWKYGSHRMEEYAAATARVAREDNCAFADVFNNWQAVAARKKPEDLLGNNINHPNDFGHWIYYRVFCGLGL